MISYSIEITLIIFTIFIIAYIIFIVNDHNKKIKLIREYNIKMQEINNEFVLGVEEIMNRNLEMALKRKEEEIKKDKLNQRKFYEKLILKRRGKI